MDFLIAILFIGIFLLVILLAITSFYFFRLSRKLNELLEKGKIKDFKEILLAQKDKNAHLEEEIAKIFEKIKTLEGFAEISLQKKAIIRFNPFNELGGKQSFVVALLDQNNNGFVISSLFVKEGNRVYAKNIKNGKSETLLSAEEIEALEKAIHGK